MYEVEIGYTERPRSPSSWWIWFSSLLPLSSQVTPWSWWPRWLPSFTVTWCYMFKLFKVQMCLHFKHMLHSASLLYLKHKEPCEHELGQPTRSTAVVSPWIILWSLDQHKWELQCLAMKRCRISRVSQQSFHGLDLLLKLQKTHAHAHMGMGQN